MEPNDPFLQKIVTRLKQVGGIQAVVLGGSRARRLHSPESDYDIGLLITSQLDLSGLQEAARELDDRHTSGLVTPPGEWGPWINGGGWLRIEGQPVDFLYRDSQKVAQVIENCLHGQISVDYQAGHPFGFPSHIYAGEAAVCLPLDDPHGIVAGFKALVLPYPAVLKRAVLRRFFWEADFSLQNAKKAASREDLLYVSGCCFRTCGCLLQCLFAANEVYWLNEKGALEAANHFALAPDHLRIRIETGLRTLAAGPGGCTAAIDLLAQVVEETARLLKAADLI